METALEKRGPVALAERPSFIKEGDLRGTENIGSNDIKPPALRIAQSGTPQTKRAEGAVYIQGLQEGMLFNSLSREIFGEGPISLVVINQLGHRHVEFAPKSEGGGVLDFNVPDGDPRTDFTEGVIDGKKVRLKPAATKFYDYLVFVVLPERSPIMMTMSLKSTQLKKAVDLNTLLKTSKLPSFAFLFNVSTMPEKRGGNSFYGWRFDAAGYVGDEHLYREASDLYDKMKGKKIEVETEGADPAPADDEIPF